MAYTRYRHNRVTFGKRGEIPSLLVITRRMTFNFEFQQRREREREREKKREGEEENLS